MSRQGTVRLAHSRVPHGLQPGIAARGNAGYGSVAVDYGNP